ncbi:MULTISPECIES: hypothetical protein [unclassified Bradyrhizobium]|uniref:hypothetical protein n=1 Tax=unclassified Bradyrhizobium TaxID=2631580 RepID=UPI001BA523DE|nr:MULTISPECIES: hypothetical protein [unclassified Bradyrhizobium]MBR1204075.1 hypothetical protein [Bradyrhizobium sp. AUGA SZCCT0124]MBR1310039.1 hypothetical protein [Bradyrhizobium sp. AUGA SZCCT0051]MBR1340180.1 hypothetical protein [Bradyrhizobium sp. AUGA SZCCT0105]MBR1354787.1 hypothetical protein [Bradyrhizobium sp. AUGA SZCCT0045]
MDDYRDLVAAGFTILCAALMLVAGLLLLGDRPEPASSDRHIEPPAAAPQSISSIEPVSRPCDPMRTRLF